MTQDDNDTSKTSASPSASRSSMHKGSAYEEYLYGRSIFSNYDLKPNWSSTTRGRLAIRLVSRGVSGALAFAFAQRYAFKQLTDYDPDLFKWGEVGFFEKPLQYVAKSFDVVFGKPIQYFVRSIAPASKKAMWVEDVLRFRPKAYFFSTPGQRMGRSLGSEMVAVTFDFSAMSFADAMTRNVIQAFDPNLPQTWFVDKDGHPATRAHGKFNVQKWSQSALRATWRSLSKNAGEDWFAALPYVYQMKWQREMLSKIPVFDPYAADAKNKHGHEFDGFKISSDRNRNGGNLVVNQDGKIIGDHHLPGIIDLQLRFVGYNVYTLIFREFYDAIGRGIKHTLKHGVDWKWELPKDPIGVAVDAVGNSGRYLLKSAIKANLFMQPAVPFFWVFRTPQSKWRSELILQGGDPSQNPIGTWKPQATGTASPHHPDVYRFPYPLTYNEWVRPTKGVTGTTRPKDLWFGNQKVPYPKSLEEKGLYHFDNCPTLISKLLNPFGWISYTTGTQLVKTVQKLVPMQSELSYLIAGTRDLSQVPLQRAVLLRTYVDAAYSYTPYFMAKDEFGLRVNDSGLDGKPGNMDKAIYKLIDNTFTLRWGKIGQSLGEIWDLSTDSLQQKDVLHYEGKRATDVLVQNRKTKQQSAPQATTVTFSAPSTKVEATSVQYQTTPPTHLRHTSSDAAARSDETASWADSMADRHQQQLHPQIKNTLH